MNETDSTTCPYCGDEMPPRRGPARKQCGKPECKRLYTNARMRQWNATHPGYFRKYGTADHYEHECEVCGDTFKSHKPVQRTCSVECHKERLRRRHVQVIPHPAPYSDLPANHPAVLMQQPEYKRLFIAGRCRRCGDYFVVNAPHGEAAFCSDRCSHRHHEHVRRMKKRGANHTPYSRRQVFERDGWRCHICRRLVRRDVDHLHPLSPTIDHLVPLANGGRDEAANVACAHFVCNTLRSNRGEAQLLLYG